MSPYSYVLTLAGRDHYKSPEFCPEFRLSQELCLEFREMTE